MNDIAGNMTVLEYLEEDFHACYNTGPGHGMFFCDNKVVPSGPHFLGIHSCKLYNKNDNGHMEMVKPTQ